MPTPRIASGPSTRDPRGLGRRGRRTDGARRRRPARRGRGRGVVPSSPRALGPKRWAQLDGRPDTPPATAATSAPSSSPAPCSARSRRPSWSGASPRSGTPTRSEPSACCPLAGRGPRERNLLEPLQGHPGVRPDEQAIRRPAAGQREAHRRRSPSIISRGPPAIPTRFASNGRWGAGRRRPGRGAGHGRGRDVAVALRSRRMASPS